MVGTAGREGREETVVFETTDVPRRGSSMLPSLLSTSRARPLSGAAGPESTWKASFRAVLLLRREEETEGGALLVAIGAWRWERTGSCWAGAVARGSGSGCVRLGGPGETDSGGEEWKGVWERAGL